MSADNGVYIAKFSDGYRVAHIQAIDTLDYLIKNFGENSREVRRFLTEVFKKSGLYQSKDDAILFGFNLEKEIGFVEYGVSYIGEFNFSFV